jgi:hypothetical protein
MNLGGGCTGETTDTLRHSTDKYVRLKAVVRWPDMLATKVRAQTHGGALGPSPQACTWACTLPRGASESPPRPVPPGLRRRIGRRRQRTGPAH